MKGIEDTKNELPRLKDDEKMYVYLQGTHFQQTNVIITNNNNVINICCLQVRSNSFYKR